MSSAITRRSVSLALSIAVAATAFSGVRPVNAATTTLPNLKMAHLRDIKVTVEGGRRLLRFTTIMVNLGAGPFELRGRRSSTSQSTMTVDQRIYNDAGGSAYYPTTATMRYAGDGHDHWHAQGVMTYELWREGAPNTIRQGAKTGFCFFDTTAWSLGLPNARQSSYYREEWCGTAGVLSNRVGISVGWGDRYPWNFAFQWIDVTSMPAGTYMLRATVDQQNLYRERNNNDNCVWARISLPASGSAVSVLARGSDCGPESVRPVTTFPGGATYDPPRRLAFDAGTYTGYKFNSAGTVLATKRSTLPGPSGASAGGRAIPIGEDSNWFYVIDGLWAGYWIRDTAAIDQVH